MERRPTAEDAARYVLSIFIDHNPRAGHALGTDNFIEPFSRSGWGASDFNPGMEYAIKKNWIESDRADNFMLTDAGLAEAEA